MSAAGSNRELLKKYDEAIISFLKEHLRSGISPGPLLIEPYFSLVEGMFVNPNLDSWMRDLKKSFLPGRNNIGTIESLKYYLKSQGVQQALSRTIIERNRLVPLACREYEDLAMDAGALSGKHKEPLIKNTPSYLSDAQIEKQVDYCSDRAIIRDIKTFIEQNYRYYTRLSVHI